MPAYELREHRTDHGYNVLGKYVTVDEAWARKTALIAENQARQGRYTIEYVQSAEPDPVMHIMGIPVFIDPTMKENEMALRRTKAPPVEVAQPVAKPVSLPKNSAADVVDDFAEKNPTVSEAAAASGAKTP